MEKELTILKLGGSLLTDKTKPYSLRESVLDSVAKEIGECIDSGALQSLILLNGVGSFGHPPVLEYGLHKGFRDKNQLFPLSKTQQIVNEFRLNIVRKLQEFNVAVNIMHPSSMVVSEKMRMKEYFLAPVKGYLDIGMIPLLGGDVVVDTAMGFSIGSADQLAAILAHEFKAKRLIFATDVKGIFESDPKIDPNAAIVDEIDLNDLDAALKKMGISSIEDASGAMKGKLLSLTPLKDRIAQGLEVSIISMMESGNLRCLLEGNLSSLTKVVAK
jgi:isopentenyl phosphate kinase